MCLALRAGGLGDDGFYAVQAGVNHLRAQWAGNASSNHEHRGAMHERPNRKHKASVLAGSSAEALGEALAHQIERWPGLVQRWRLGKCVEEHSIGVRMFEREFEIALAGLRDGAGAAEDGEEFDASLDADGAENIVAVAIAFIDSGSRRAGGLRNA